MTCPYFSFRTITWININGFSPNLIHALILWRSGLWLLIGNFWQSYLPMNSLYFHLRTIIWVNLNEFSPNIICALILWRSGLRLIRGKFHQFLIELSACDMIMAGYYRFTFFFKVIIPSLVYFSYIFTIYIRTQSYCTFICVYKRNTDRLIA